MHPADYVSAPPPPPMPGEGPGNGLDLNFLRKIVIFGQYYSDLMLGTSAMYSIYVLPF